MAIDAGMKNKIFFHNQANPYVDITLHELQAGFPIVNYVGFFCQSDEMILYAVPAATFKDKEQVTGYVGQSAQTSIRLTRTVAVRTGSSSRKTVRNIVRKHNFGDLIITNKRIVFIGKDDSFDFAVKKISAVKQLGVDTFLIQCGRDTKGLCVDGYAIIYTMDFINYAVSSFANGRNLIAEKQRLEANVTQEQRALCNHVHQELAAMNAFYERRRSRSKKKKYVIIFLGIVLLFILLLLGSISNIETEEPSQLSTVHTAYSDAEILNLEGHPRVYDDYETSRDFYAGIENVNVLSGSEHSRIQQNLDSRTDEDVFLYLIQHPVDKNYVGEVQINLFSPELYADMNAEKGVDILLDYLPEDFLTYYQQDSCYQYGDDTTAIYTYSCRLNEAGIQRHNNGYSQYSYYYYLRVIHYIDTNRWLLKTGYAAYGDKDIEWIEKYAEPWNIDINNL